MSTYSNRKGFDGERFSKHFSSEDGDPDGGVASGPGFTISWQRGALAGEDVESNECIVAEHWLTGPASNPGHDSGESDAPCRRGPNGAYVETVLEAVADRLAYYQRGKFNCRDNQAALRCIEQALGHLRGRSDDRRFRGVEGTHRV